jgi:hypothetical protein
MNRMETTPNAAEGEEEKPAPTIYRWTDENGQVYYSDKPVKK